MPETVKQSGRSICAWGAVMVVMVVHAFISNAVAGEDRPRVRHAYLGCSLVEADAIYGLPGQEQLVPPAAGGGVRTQRVYKTANGRMVEVWFGKSGAEAILLPGENDPEVIHQLLLDSAANETWELDGRIWRRSDGTAVAAIMRQKAFFIGTAPWLVKAVEAEARGKK